MSRFEEEYGTFEPDPPTIGEIWDYINKKIKYLEDRIEFHNIHRVFGAYNRMTTELDTYKNMLWFIKTGYMKQREDEEGS